MRSVLECELRDHLALFLDGEFSLPEFDEWFVLATLHIEQIDDPGAEELTWEIMLRLAEYSNGHRSMSDLKDILRSFADASSARIPVR